LGKVKALQLMVSVRIVVVVDSYAFAMGKVCLILLDAAERVVRWLRVAAEDAMVDLETSRV
jgi:hypothetical protein